MHHKCTLISRRLKRGEETQMERGKGRPKCGGTDGCYLSFMRCARVRFWSFCASWTNAMMHLDSYDHKCVRTSVITYCTAKLCLARLFADIFGSNKLHGRVSRVSSPVSSLLDSYVLTVHTFFAHRPTQVVLRTALFT